MNNNQKPHRPGMLSKGHKLPDTPHGTEQRRRRPSADEWRVKAEELEKEKMIMKQFLQQAAKYENDLEVQLGRLKENRDVVHSQMKLREKGLQLQQYRESEYKASIAELYRRIEEMSRMIRHKEQQLETLRYKNLAQKREIEMLNAKIDNKIKGLWKIPDHKIEAKNTSKGVKLPILASSLVKQYHDSSTNLSEANTNACPDDESSPSKRLKNGLSTTMKDSCRCAILEKTIGRMGGTLALPAVILSIPREAVMAATRITMCNVFLDKSCPFVAELKTCGLLQLVRPRFQLSLQPFTVRLNKPGTLQLTVHRQNKAKKRPTRIFVCFMQNINETEDDFVWVAEESTAMASVSDMISAVVVSVKVGQLCGIALLELVAENETKNDNNSAKQHVASIAAGTGANNALPAGGIVTLVAAALNSRTAACLFVVFSLLRDEETLRVVCISSASQAKESLLLKGSDVNVTYFGTGTGRLKLCDDEVLSFYFDKDSKCAGIMSLDMSKVLSDGHRYRMPFYSCTDSQPGSDSFSSETHNPLPHPSFLRIKRRIMGPNSIIEDNVCVIHIKSTKREYAL